MPVCWYCGTADAVIYKREHQLPLRLGGRGGANLVDACQPCNRLKGGHTVTQFRAEIEVRLGEPVGMYPAQDLWPQMLVCVPPYQHSDMLE